MSRLDWSTWRQLLCRVFMSLLLTLLQCVTCGFLTPPASDCATAAVLLFTRLIDTRPLQRDYHFNVVALLIHSALPVLLFGHTFVMVDRRAHSPTPLRSTPPSVTGPLVTIVAVDLSLRPKRIFQSKTSNVAKGSRRAHSGLIAGHCLGSLSIRKEDLTGAFFPRSFTCFLLPFC